MRLSDIPIMTTDFSDNTTENHHSATAILYEISALLQQLLETGEDGIIDLNTIPLSPQDYQYLEDVLSQGEVEATVSTLGLSTIFETRFTGVWWIKHFDENDQLVTELIEVTHIPAILKSAPRDIEDGLTLLQQQIQINGGEHVQ
jgi:hydrogenase-1 operon protein HyaF